MKKVSFISSDSDVTVHEQVTDPDPGKRWYHIIANSERDDKTGTFMYGDEIEALARWWEKEKKRKVKEESISRSSST